LKYKDTVKTKESIGVQAFADALLIIPKVLAENSGFDVQETVLRLIAAYKERNTEKDSVKVNVGIDILKEDSIINPETQGIFDNYIVKKQFLNIAPLLAEQLLLVDEVMKAGKKMGGGLPEQGPE